MPKKTEKVEKQNKRPKMLHITLSDEATAELEAQAAFDMRTVTSLATMVLEKHFRKLPFKRENNE